MRKLGIILGSIVMFIALFIGGAIAWVKFITYPDYSYRYRLALSIESDGKVHTGSSVIEVTWSGGIPFGDVGPYVPVVRGQAAFIGLGERGAVVAVLTAPSHEERGRIVWPEGVSAIFLGARAFGNSSTYDELPQLPRLSGLRNLTPDNMPRLIWFSDVRDPKTLRVIKAADIPELFGSNARLASAYVEITRDRIVIDIDKKLPWFERLTPRLSKIQIGYEFWLAKSMFIEGAS